MITVNVNKHIVISTNVLKKLACNKQAFCVYLPKGTDNNYIVLSMKDAFSTYSSDIPCSFDEWVNNLTLGKLPLSNKGGLYLTYDQLCLYKSGNNTFNITSWKQE